MTLNTNKQAGDTIEPTEWNEAATAANEVTDGTLTITESQISDLGAYITDYTVTNTDLTGLNISELTNDSNYVTSGSNPSFTDISYSTATSTIPAFANLGTTYTVDFATGTHFSGILNSDVTLTFSNAVSGDKVTLIFEYDGVAQRTITYPTGVMWAGGSAPTAPASAGKLVVTIMYDGVNYLASGVVFN